MLAATATVANAQTLRSIAFRYALVAVMWTWRQRDAGDHLLLAAGWSRCAAHPPAARTAPSGRVRFAARADHLNRCVQRQQGGGRVGGMDRDAGVGAEQGMKLVLAIAGRAVAAALQPAGDVRAAEVPAARPLQEIAADRRHIAKLGRGRRRGRFRQRRIARPDQRVRFELGERRQGADLEAVAGVENPVVQLR